MLTRRIPLKRTPFVRKRPKVRRGPERSPEYLAWIRTLPCAVCRRRLGVEASHTNALGPRGFGQKSSDFSAIPLCFWHHRGHPDSYHGTGERKFAQKFGLDLELLVADLNQEYSRIFRLAPKLSYEPRPVDGGNPMKSKSGDALADSDIDVLVVLHGTVIPLKEARRISEFRGDLCLRHNVVISCVYVSANEAQTGDTPLLTNIRAEGVPL